MKYKICQVIFSTNRLEYLIPNLKSQQMLNFWNCDIYRILIDDYPSTRNNIMFKSYLEFCGINEVILHNTNIGLSATWTEFWNLIKNRDYDYVFHQEDDIEFLEPVLFTDLIEILENDPKISQVTLSRQAWYSNEQDPESSPNDIIYKNFRYQKNSVLFSPMASLYNHRLTKIDYSKFYEFNLNEGLIGKALYENYGLFSANVKNYFGRKLINHIGEWFTGKRLLPGEPGFELYGHYDPNKKYYSKDGQLYNK